MKINLTEVGGATTDITPYLMVEERFVITQETERQAFQRTVDDVRLSLSNMRDVFSGLFARTGPTTRWVLEIYGDTRKLFRGDIDNESIDFTQNGKTVTFDAFSSTKLFWDRAKKTFIHPTDVYIQVGPYIDLQTLLNHQMVITNLYNNRKIMNGFDAGRYANRQIRIAGLTTDPDIGNEGLFIYLNDDTTWETFLKACALEYNAEFVMDIDTQVVRMLSRGKGLSSNVRDIDALLKSDSPIDVFWIDDQKIDYLYFMGNVQQPTPVFLNFLTNVGLPAFRRGITMYYLTTAVFEDQEAVASKPLTVTIPSDLSTDVHIKIRIPATQIQGVLSQNVYRWNPLGSSGSGAGFFLIANVPISETDLTDNFLGAQLAHPLPVTNTFLNLWEHYDELTNGWTTIADIRQGAGQPDGVIFSVLPDLHFRIGETVVPDDPFWIFSLFGKQIDFTSPEVQADWADVFRTKRRAEVTVKGTDYRVGDRFISSRGTIPNDLTSSPEIIVKRAAIDPIAKETKLTLLTV